jgi:hypothetical protein
VTPATSSSGFERVLLITNQHWVTYIVPVMIAIIIGIAGLFLYILAGYTAHHAMWISHAALILGLGLVLLAHHWIFHRILSKIADVIIITNDRVIDMRIRLLLHEAMFEVQLGKVQSVTASKRNILATLLNYGDIEFKPSGSLQYIPYPQRVAREIEKAMGMA